MKVSFSLITVNSKAIFMKLCQHYFIAICHISLRYCIAQKLGHLTCITFFLIMTPLYKPINFIPVYYQNCVACQMVSLLKYSL